MRFAFCLFFLCSTIPLHAQQAAPACCQPAWAGIYPTVLTPWSCGCEGVDTAALTCEIQHQLAGGVHGLLVLGTLGEGMYASDSERAQVISTAVACTLGKVPVIVGIHASDYSCALQQLKQAKQLGAKAVLVKFTGPARTPFCEVLGFFHALADAGELPLFYYHIPGSVDRKLSRTEVVQVLSHPNIIGVKESILDLREVQAHIQGVCGQGKVFLSGTALNLTQFRAIGGHGAMCPEAAILPCDTVAAYSSAYEVGDRRGARQQQKDLFVLAPILKGGLITSGAARAYTMTSQDLKLPQQLGKDQSQARLKALLNERGIAMNAKVKSPLPQLSSWDRHLVRTTARKLD